MFRSVGLSAREHDYAKTFQAIFTEPCRIVNYCCGKYMFNFGIHRAQTGRTAAIFTARAYARAVLGVVILSVRLAVCPSVTRVDCDKTK